MKTSVGGGSVACPLQADKTLIKIKLNTIRKKILFILCSFFAHSEGMISINGSCQPPPKLPGSPHCSGGGWRNKESI
jgi:hypothetical protein